MKVKGTYQGNNEILVAASYGVGESIVKSNYTLVDETDDKGKVLVAKTEPSVGTAVEIDIDSNGRDEVTLAQQAAYDAKQCPQDEIPPAQIPFGEFKAPRKIK